MEISPKPLILLTATPIAGHINPLQVIAHHLVARGYDVSVLTGVSFQKNIERLGASFFPLSGFCDFTIEDIMAGADGPWPGRDHIPPGPEQLAHDVEHCFIGSMRSQFESCQAALRAMSAREPGRPIILMSENFFWGALPSQLGATGIKPTGLIELGLTPLLLQSVDLPPFGPGLPPDNSPEGRIRNKLMNQQVQTGIFGKAQAAFCRNFEELGCQSAPPYMFDSAYILPDRFVQMSPPSVEYPRSDLPSHVRFSGGRPEDLGEKIVAEHPHWWDEVIINRSSSKRLVFATQGTVALNYADLIVPTMKALGGREDVVVVVALGMKGATLSEDVEVPANVFVEDFVPYDDILPSSDVFVTNAGYGGFQHALSHGCPMVLAGASEEKPEVAARGEYAGVGINLKTGSPSVAQIKEAVDEVLGNKKFKARSLELKKEMESFDPIGVIVQNIEEVVFEKREINKSINRVTEGVVDGVAYRVTNGVVEVVA